MSARKLQGPCLESCLRLILLILMATPSLQAEWEQATLASPANPTHMTAADMDGDGDQDLLISLYSGGTVLLTNPGSRISGWITSSIPALATLTKASRGMWTGTGIPTSWPSRAGRAGVDRTVLTSPCPG